MKKKTILGTILTLSLVITFAIAAFSPALADNKPSTSRSGTAANVKLQLPPPGGALASHPTNLRFDVFDYDTRSGGMDSMVVWLWVSSLNQYVPIAMIADQDPPASGARFWNNTPAYLEVNGVVIRNNLKTVADKELDVWTEKAGSSSGNGRWSWDQYGRYVWDAQSDNTLIANLTVSITLDYTGLPSIFGSSFTLPSMTLKFIKIADGYLYESTQKFPSGAIYQYEDTHVPAWVSATITPWLGGSATEVVGRIGQHFTETTTLPT